MVQRQAADFELPFVWFIRWCCYVVTSDGDKWVTSFGCPGIKHEWNLSWKILAKLSEHIFIWDTLLNPTLSSSLTCSSTTLARFKISFWTVVWCRISTSKSDGQVYNSRQWNEPWSTSWKACSNAMLYEYIFSEDIYVPHLHRPPIPQYNWEGQQSWRVAHGIELQWCHQVSPACWGFRYQLLAVHMNSLKCWAWCITLYKDLHDHYVCISLSTQWTVTKTEYIPRNMRAQHRYTSSEEAKAAMKLLLPAEKLVYDTK